MINLIECAIKALKRVLHIKSKDEIFCREWAKLSTKEHVFDIKFYTYSSWSIKFYDLHKWNGYKSHWNNHDVKCGNGKTLKEAWKSLSNNILEYECVNSKEEALIKAELEMKRNWPRGWAYKAFEQYYYESNGH